MGDFNFSQKVAPVQDVDTDTSGGYGGHGGESAALAFGYNEAKSGDSVAVGGHSSADSEAGDDDGWGWPYGGGRSSADSDSRGGNADADTGDATTWGYTSAGSTADGGRGGDGGNANVDANQDTTVRNEFDFNRSFNEDNDTTYANHSFNQDNDGVDNAGGHINNSVVAGDDINESFNSEDEYNIDRSFNTDNSTNIDESDDDEYDIDIDESFNREDNDVLELHLLNDLNILS